MGLVLSGGRLAERFDDLRHRPAHDLVLAVRNRVNYDNHSFGLRRDLTVDFAAPEPRIPLEVRPLEDRDIVRIVDPAASGLSDEERAERRPRMAMLNAGFETAYVAATEADEPAYIQWLIGPSQNELLASHFHGIFPPLARDEALLEGAFTPEAYRGKRAMPYAMACVAERGTALGARYVFTFVAQDNGASLAGCTRAGFAPYLTRHESWRAFHRRLEFGELPDASAS